MLFVPQEAYVSELTRYYVYPWLVAHDDGRSGIISCSLQRQCTAIML